MKKTRKNADGTEEVLEGEAEEIRKYEDLQKPTEQAPITESPKKPGILHGAEVDGVPLSENEIEWVRALRNMRLGETLQPAPDRYKTRPWYDQEPIWIVSCSLCHRANCRGACYLKFSPHITYSTGTTTDKVKLLVQDDGGSKLSHSLVDVLMGRATVEVKTNGN